MNRQQLLTSGLLVGMLAAYWFLLARDELAEIGSLKTEIQALHGTLRAFEGRAADLHQAHQELDEVGGWLERVQAQYAIDGTAPDFLMDVATALRACKLTPRETTPGSVRTRLPFTEQSIHVMVQGGLEDVFAFLQRMEQSRPFCRVTALHVTPTPASGEVRADMTMLRLWRES